VEENIKRATIVDVAKLSGVSIATVSRVINGNYPVSDKTKKKVNMAIESLGFRPNLLARSLIQDKSHTIGILTPSIENLFFSEVIKGIEGYVRCENYRVFLCDTEGRAESERELIDSLVNRSVDGVIVIDPSTENITSGYYEGLTKRVSVLLINGYNEDINCNYVMSDEKVGTYEVLAYLFNKGYKNIGFLRGSSSYSYDIKENYYMDFLEKNQLPVDQDNILRIEAGNSVDTVSQAKECLIHYYQKGKAFEAIFCCNDYMAVGVLNGARALGLLVPKHLRIVGFDNTMMSQMTEPKLSTVDQHMGELGVTAAKRMLELINDSKNSIQKISIPTKFILRHT
jgi:LacI family transcriptional regulator